MSREGTKGEQARAEILEAAKTLFLSNGYHGTSMRAIAQASGGRAVAGLYNHFPTKEAIFRALIEERNPYGVLLEALRGAVDDAATVPEFLDGAIRAVLAVMPQHYDFLQLAQIDIREFEGQNLQHVLEQFFPTVLLVFRRVQALPGGRSVPDVAWVRLLGSFVIGYLVTEQIAPQSVFSVLPREEWTDLLIDVLLHGFTGDDGAGEGTVS